MEHTHKLGAGGQKKIVNAKQMAGKWWKVLGYDKNQAPELGRIRKFKKYPVLQDSFSQKPRPRSNQVAPGL